MDSMNDSSKPESPQVFVVICDAGYKDSMIDSVFFDRGRALNRRTELEMENSFDYAYRVEAWREGDTEGEEIKPD